MNLYNYLINIFSSIIKDLKAKIYEDAYVKAMLDHYFFGDPKPSDDLRVSKYKNEIAESKTVEKEAVKEQISEEAPVRRRRTEVAEEKEVVKADKEVVEEEAPRRRRAIVEDTIEEPKAEKEPVKEEVVEEAPRRRRRVESEEVKEEATPKAGILSQLEDLDD